MLTPQLILGISEEIVVDLFAGGGGMSTAIEQAIGRHVDVAVNHNAEAVSMHQVNHPQTKHYIGDVWEVDPREATEGRAVGLVHLSSECTHHSQAAGGQPRNQSSRSLTWVGKRWAGQVMPRVITLENVKQILQWGPLIAKRDKATGRVLKLDGTVAEAGERVPLQEQYLIPDPKRTGKTWRAFVTQLRAMGYAVEWKILCAADFGAPTTRERLFMVARCDGEPIRWPEPTHTKIKTKGKKRWRSAAECIDWDIPCPSIFEREKPLADATLRRIARGLKKYVLDSADPFIVPIAHYNGRDACNSVREPLRTVTASPKGGTFAVAAPVLAKLRGDSVGTRMDEPVPTITSGGNSKRPAGAPHALGVISPVLVQTGYGEREGQAPRSLDLDAPLGTVVAGGIKHAVATAYLAQMNGGFNTTPGHDVRRPASTITNTGSQQQVVMAHLTHLRGNCDARDVEDPLMTISAGGQHHGVVSAFLSRQFGASVGHGADAPLGTITAGGGGKSALVSAFLATNTTGHTGVGMDEPIPTLTTGQHQAQVECTLSPDDEAGALRVAAFLIRYYGEGGQWGDPRNPMATITTKDRLALVTVHIEGTPYVIVDIGLRMLQPRELYRAQGFPESYIIDHGHDGRKFSKSAQVRMCGNSVSPPPAAALIRANYADARGRMVA
ncbi:DNA cytosine methyltransferase [Acidithiobacillus ferrooxidans]|uniref:DNA cytosine methyltransferase n=1 Tax=Acidithiobacillus ferrooxidans TaxID=920 RepID=UPI000B18AC87|nr:DNA cytosine methyltransferase [Acidithiobacillus ferrooxidans]